jgi:hypothetical protein
MWPAPTALPVSGNGYFSPRIYFKLIMHTISAVLIQIQKIATKKVVFTDFFSCSKKTGLSEIRYIGNGHIGNRYI